MTINIPEEVLNKCADAVYGKMSGIGIDCKEAAKAALTEAIESGWVIVPSDISEAWLEAVISDNVFDDRGDIGGTWQAAKEIHERLTKQGG